MEKVRSKSLQEVSEQAENKSATINPRRFQIRDVNAKRGKRHLIQYAAPETTREQDIHQWQSPVH